MPWEPGQSGNPAGRKRENEEIKALARQHCPRAIERLAEIMDGDDPRAAAAASNSLLDRGYGKPTQVVSGEDGGPAIVVMTRYATGDADRDTPP